MTAPEREHRPRPGTVHPHLARERALKVLFQADVRGLDARQLLDQLETTRGALELLDELEPDEAQVAADDELQQELTRRARIPLDGYTRTLVAGVAARRRSIDDVLEAVAEHWRVARMPVLDRNLLRLAVYELAVQDTPPAVVIDEAVQLAGGFAGEKARPFVNGVLENVRRQVAAGTIALVDEGPPVDRADTAGSSTAPADAVGPGDEATAGTSDPDGDDDAGDDDAPVAWDAALDLLTALDDDGESSR